MIKETRVGEINESIQAGECQVIDVREFPEYQAERIHNSKFVPLSDFERRAEAIDHTKPVYLLCRSGNRARQAANKLLTKGFTDVHVIEGGIQAWAKASLPLVKNRTRVWSLERQVRFTAGLVGLMGVLLSVLIWQPFIWVSGFISAGLVFSAATDTCGMALLLARLPWNKEREGSQCESPACG